MGWDTRYARRAQGMVGSTTRELLKLTERPDFISLAGGLPAPESFPVAAVAAATDAVLRERGSLALQYSATEGYRPLRELVASRLAGPALELSAENVLITTGSQQALDLLGKVFLDAGDRVLVETPTYMAALQAWRAYEATYVGVPMDESGLDPEALDEPLRQDPKFLYTVSSFQNPTGVTLTAERRHRLVELAIAHDLPIVEDDPYSALRFAGVAPPSLLAVAGAAAGAGPYDGTVIHLSTFSKTLAPGLRVGYIVAPADVIGRIALAKQGTDLHSGTLDQHIAHRLIAEGQIESRIDGIAARYRERRDAMLDALAEYFPPEARWTHPEGGMFLWVTLPPGTDTAAILRHAVAQGVAFVPGAAFHPNGGGHNTMRLSFSNASTERITEGIARLGRVLIEHGAPVPVPGK